MVASAQAQTKVAVLVLLTGVIHAVIAFTTKPLSSLNTPAFSTSGRASRRTHHAHGPGRQRSRNGCTHAFPCTSTSLSTLNRSPCAAQPRPLSSLLDGSDASQRVSRRAVVESSLWTIAMGSVLLAAAPSHAADATLPELKAIAVQARQELDPCLNLIDHAKWDSVRTVVKRKPLVDMKNVSLRIAELLDDDRQERMLEVRSDLMDHLAQLDMRVYNNVFIGEDRQILGTKIDYEGPKEELAACKKAMDDLLALLD